MALFLIELLDDEIISESNFIHSHQLDGEDIEVRRLPQSNLEEYDAQQEMDAAHGAN